MPFAFYKILTPRDADAVVAYIRSVNPVRNEVQAPVYKAEAHAELIPNAEKPVTEETLSDPVKRGFYLATIGHCMECHTPFAQGGGPDFAGSLGRGGREFPGPWGISKSRNITSSKTAGLGNWTDAEIKTAITRGKSRDGSPLKGPMGFEYYANMTDADLDAVIAYLRTVPAKD
jgi:mono/diheme cytochrome c family protein